MTPGRARSRSGDGRVAEVEYRAGDIARLSFGAGEPMTHDLANIDDTMLTVTAVAFPAALRVAAGGAPP